MFEYAFEFTWTDNGYPYYLKYLVLANDPIEGQMKAGQRFFEDVPSVAVADIQMVGVRQYGSGKVLGIGPRVDRESYRLSPRHDTCTWHNRKINGQWYEFMKRTSPSGIALEYRVTKLGHGVVHNIKVD